MQGLSSETKSYSWGKNKHTNEKDKYGDGIQYSMGMNEMTQVL